MANEQWLIDANVLMEHLDSCINESKGLVKSLCVAIKCFVEQMPTVDAVEVVHGRWLRSIDNECEMHECSVCGARVVKGLYEYDNPNIYCYHCGAKMDGDMENNRQAEVIR